MKLFEMLQNKFKNMSAKEAYEYTLIYGPTPELEAIISTNPLYSYRYADKVLGGRFLAGEKAIATIQMYSYLYAFDILGGRFYEGEEVILKDLGCAFQYAKDILGRRWLKAEPIIRKSKYWPYYKKYFNIK